MAAPDVAMTPPNYPILADSVMHDRDTAADDEANAATLTTTRNSGLAGVLRLLEDDDPSIQTIALNHLLELADTAWPDIAEGLVTIESLAAEPSAPYHQTASLLASKVLFQLEELEDALYQAMKAGPLFDVHSESEYTQTVVCRAVDRYIQTRAALYENSIAAFPSTSDASSSTINASPQPSSTTANTSTAAAVNSTDLEVDARLEALVERMMDDARSKGLVGEKHALGVALESRRLDKVETILRESPNQALLLKYCTTNATSLVSSSAFRQSVLEVVVKIYDAHFESPNFLSECANICRALFLVGEADRVAQVFHDLVYAEEDEEDTQVAPSMAYQIAFDLVELENQPFLATLLSHPLLQLPELAPLSPEAAVPHDMNIDDSKSSNVKGDGTDGEDLTREDPSKSASPTPPKDTDTNATVEGGAEESGVSEKEPLLKETSQRAKEDRSASPSSLPATTAAPVESSEESELLLSKAAADASSQQGQDSSSGPATSAAAPAVASDPAAASSSTKPTDAEDEQSQDTKALKNFVDLPIDYIRVYRLRYILSGAASLRLNVEFLHRNNHSDLLLLDSIKASADARSSITQNAIVIAHALAQAGTTSDVFLRANLEWLGRSVCWAKFTAAASTGVLHKGHVEQSRKVLSAYLPGAGGGPFSEGGALYGLGLIHANHIDQDTKAYLLTQLAEAQSHCPQNYEPLQHGACLGLGLLAMGSGDTDIYTALRGVLFSDSAIAGEAAALSMGLSMLGSLSDEVISELLSYARDTEHERITRAASLGVALAMYRREEEADPAIQQLSNDMDPMIRYGAMFGIGLAYCGTSNTIATRRLLHVGVSDVSSDVRRAAVVALGFVLCNAPQQLVKIVTLLCDSFNAHVRYAAAMAIGFGCSGTASLEAVDLLLPMVQDATDFVRQGALLALGLVLVQASPSFLPGNLVVKVRDTMIRIAADKHEDHITRFGAIVAIGIMDAGGRNATASFFSSTGALRRESVVGFLLFAQLWFWYPNILAVSLALRPTMLIGMTGVLGMPTDFAVYNSAPPAMFAYVPPIQKAGKEEKKATVTAILSTTQKRQQQEQIKKFASQESGVLRLGGGSTSSPMSKSGRTPKSGAPPAQLDIPMTIAEESESKQTTEPEVQQSTEPASNVTDKADKVDSIKDVPSGEGDPTVSTAEAPGAKTSSDVVMEDAWKDTSIPSTSPLHPAAANLVFNPCRVLPLQAPYIETLSGHRYAPIVPGRKSGIVMLRDLRPDDPITFVNNPRDTLPRSAPSQ